MAQFKNVEPCYTGGGIYVFSGQTTDGNYFFADTDWSAVRLLNSEFDLANDDHFYDEWQQEHLIRDLDESECVAFVVDMLRWVIENKPQGNYRMYDIHKDFKYWSEVMVKMICGDSYDTATQTTDY